MGRLEFGRRTEHAKAWTPCICSLQECLRVCQWLILTPWRLCCTGSHDGRNVGNPRTAV